jgi:prepilin-type N-terminal cleavage/methylation domain-containing protein
MPIRPPIRSPITSSPKDESVSPSPLPARKAYRPEGSALAPRWKLRAGSRAGSLVEACPPWRVATVADNAVRAREPCGFTFAKPRGRYAFTVKERERPTLRSGRALARASAGGFTLVELIVVIALISTLMVLVAPAFTGIKSAGDVTSAAYTIKDALEQARTYAMAYKTYVWIGFYEEPAGQPPTNPATPGTGRIVISTIASADGTTVYNPRSLAAIDPTRVTQLNKLVKVEGTHLATFPDGSGTGDTFDSRPAAIYETAKIGDTTPPNPSLTPFQYPVGNPAPAAQYTFVKAVEFSPRGEARINNRNYTLKTVAEIGLQPAHGTAVDVNSRNIIVIQFGALGGDLKIYRR